MKWNDDYGRLGNVQGRSGKAYEEIIAKKNAEIAALRAQVEQLELVRLIAVDVNKWLIETERGGTAHQLQLSAALKGADHA